MNEVDRLLRQMRELHYDPLPTWLLAVIVGAVGVGAILVLIFKAD